MCNTRKLVNTGDTEWTCLSLNSGGYDSVFDNITTIHVYASTEALLVKITG